MGDVFDIGGSDRWQLRPVRYSVYGSELDRAPIHTWTPPVCKVFSLHDDVAKWRLQPYIRTFYEAANLCP